MGSPGGTRSGLFVKKPELPTVIVVTAETSAGIQHSRGEGYVLSFVAMIADAGTYAIPLVQPIGGWCPRRMTCFPS